MRERDIERELVLQTKIRGGLALKFIALGVSGVPDRIVLMEGKKIAFVELKAPGKVLRPVQIKRKRQLEALGFKVYCVDNKEQIGGILNEICAT